MRHYGESRTLCGYTLGADTRHTITQEIQKIECPNCVAGVLVATDEVFNGYYNRDAREYVSEPIVYAIVMRLDKSQQCDARGVFQTESGKLYTFTVRKSGHGDVGAHRFREERFLAESWDGTAMSLSRLAEGMLRFEDRYMSDWVQRNIRSAIRDAKNRERRELSDAMHAGAQRFMTTPDTLV